MKEIKNKKIVFIDLDGTLFDGKDNQTGISQTNIDALSRLISRGITPVISTGRIHEQAHELVKESGVEYSIQGNGSKILNSANKTLHSEHLPYGSGKRIFDLAKSEKLLFIANGNLTFQGMPSLEFKKHFQHMNFGFQDDYDFYPDLSYVLGLYDFKNEAQQDKMISKIKNMLPEASVLKIEKPVLAIEITSIKATKGLGNTWLANHLGFHDPKTWLHIGDSMNDFSAAEIMDLVAMDNSNEKLKKVAKFIGPNYKNDGVAKILDKIV